MTMGDPTMRTRNVKKTQETNGSLSPGVMTMGSPFQSLTTLLPGGYSLRSIPTPPRPIPGRLRLILHRLRCRRRQPTLGFFRKHQRSGRSVSQRVSLVRLHPHERRPGRPARALGRTRGAVPRVSNDDETRDPEESASALAVTSRGVGSSSSTTTSRRPGRRDGDGWCLLLLPSSVVLSGSHAGTDRTMRHTGDPSTTCGANRSPTGRWSLPGIVGEKRVDVSHVGEAVDLHLDVRLRHPDGAGDEGDVGGVQAGGDAGGVDPFAEHLERVGLVTVPAPGRKDLGRGSRTLGGDPVGRMEDEEEDEDEEADAPGEGDGSRDVAGRGFVRSGLTWRRWTRPRAIPARPGRFFSPAARSGGDACVSTEASEVVGPRGVTRRGARRRARAGGAAARARRSWRR